ncbi:MAG: hypothetical protein WC139_06560 [Candidatus Kapaibacterium sp.]
MKKMLYIMGESWYWIKQRPHFFAEYLSNDYHIDLVFEKRYTKRVDNTVPTNIICHELFKFPKTHNTIIKRFNNSLIKKSLKKIINGNKYDIILINNYKHYDLIKNFISADDYVVYDCMDDFAEFKGSKRSEAVHNEILNQEKSLYSRSNLVAFSSEYLKQKLISRYYEKDNSIVINNAVELNFDETGSSLPATVFPLFSESMKNICYIGTVSDWFDFSLVLNTLEKFKDINFVLVGPSDTEIPHHERLQYHTQIPHSSLMKVMKKADLLVMPFVVDELVRSVNPVKVYEYVYSRTPSLIVYYEETEKFKDYVYLYKSELEFFDYVSKLTNNNLPTLVSEDDAIAFGNENTWEKRIKVLKEYLNIHITK